MLNANIHHNYSNAFVINLGHLFYLLWHIVRLESDHIIRFDCYLPMFGIFFLSFEQDFPGVSMMS